MPVQMELRRIIISEIHESQVIVLREVDGERSFPIVIGIFEATSIDRRVRNQTSPRPLTHDLIVSVIELMGGELQDIIISELRDHTYYAKVRVAQGWRARWRSIADPAMPLHWPSRRRCRFTSPRMFLRKPKTKRRCSLI